MLLEEQKNNLQVIVVSRNGRRRVSSPVTVDSGWIRDSTCGTVLAIEALACSSSVITETLVGAVDMAQIATFSRIYTVSCDNARAIRFIH